MTHVRGMIGRGGRAHRADVFALGCVLYDGRTLAYAVQRYLTDLCLVEGLK